MIEEVIVDQENDSKEVIVVDQIEGYFSIFSFIFILCEFLVQIIDRIADLIDNRFLEHDNNPIGRVSIRSWIQLRKWSISFNAMVDPTLLSDRWNRLTKNGSWYLWFSRQSWPTNWSRVSINKRIYHDPLNQIKLSLPKSG